MDFSQAGVVKMMDVKMNYHGERNDVLAQNVANADTPGFRPKDFAPLDFDRMVQPKKRLQMTRSLPTHSQGTHFNAPDIQAEEMRRTFELKPVKNAVNLEEQMAKVSHNAFDYQTTTTLYRKTAEMFRISVQNR